MMLLMTILTAVLFLALLLVLVLALRGILRALQGIRTNLERIVFGVRAIEVETAPLPGGLATLDASLRAATTHIDALGDGLVGLDQRVVRALTAPS